MYKLFYATLQRDLVIHTRPKPLLVFVVASTVVLLTLGACYLREGASASNPEEVIWEGWKVVEESYVDTDSLNVEVVASDIILGMLDFADTPSYPFLTHLDQVKGIVPASVPEGFEDVWRVWTLFTKTWPEVDPKLLSEAALHSMAESLEDPVSIYLSLEAYERSQEEAAGSYEGIGAVLGMQDGQLTIVSPMSASPAERAGLRRDDVILAINDESLTGKDLEEITRNVKGPVGSRVTFLIRRPTESASREITVTRATIDIPTVDMSLLPSSVGYIYIQALHDRTLDEVLDILETFKKLDTLGVILDLRSNEEGSIEVARDVAAQFLPKGLFLYELDSHQNRTELLIESSGTLTEGMKLVVLVNQGTAEAAEALAGALLDSGKGVIIGDPTRGKGSTNSYFALSNGGALYLPISYWYTPSGRAITPAGITPGIMASLSQEDLILSRDSQLAEAYDYLDKNLPAFR